MMERNMEEADMTVAMTIGELVLGVTAWVLGFVALILRREKDAARLCGMGSLACCAASLCIVVFDFAHLSDIGDTSAFLDTANAFRLAAGVLLTGTLALHTAALLCSCRKKAPASN